MVDKLRQYLSEIIIGLVVLITLLIIILYKPWEINDVEYTEYNYVVDRTDNDFYVDVLHLGLNQLGIKETAIIIRPMFGTSDIGPDIHIKAYIIGNKDQFTIFSNIGTSKLEAIEVLSHELIHLKQYNDERLIMDGDIITFDDMIYIKGMLPYYRDRPWEIEAFECQEGLAEYIRDKLLSR